MDQTYKDIELIIVNDCSTDNSLNIAKHYSEIDNRVKIINNSDNQRLPNSLNIGFKASSGNYLTWTSDDNYYDISAIEVMLAYLNRNSETGLCYADMYVVDENSGAKSSNRSFGWAGNVSELPIYDTVGACFLYKRDVYEKIGEYDPEKELIEDWDYWLRIWLEFDVIHIPKCLYTYRKHPASLTGTRFREQQRKTIEYICTINKLYSQRIPEDIRMRSYLLAAGRAKHINDKALSCKMLDLALNISENAPNYTSKELLYYATH